jgi:hypothetical protein
VWSFVSGRHEVVRAIWSGLVEVYTCGLLGRG